MLPVWAALLFYATLTEQPDPQTAFADFAMYVTTKHFLSSHLVGSIVGAAIGSIGVIGLLLYLQDTKVAGKVIAGSGRLPRWAGWLYVVSTAGFALGLFFEPIVQNITSVLLFLATVSIAGSTNREAARESVKVV